MLVRYFKYSPEIQKNIEEKKLQDQMVFTNQAAARAAKEEAELKKIVQEGMVIAAVEMEKGKGLRHPQDRRKRSVRAQDKSRG